MNSCSESIPKKGEKSKKNQNKNIQNIKSKFFLEKMFYILSRKKLLNIIQYNKQTQNILEININDYKKYCELYSPIEIEIIPAKDKYGKFINIYADKSFYHIYFNDCKNEVKKNYLIENDKVEKIKIKIDYRIQNFIQLFKECFCIQSIYFTKFYRININNMKNIFYGCSSLKEINLSNFNTNNVIDLSGMFYGCSSLKDINLSNFNTNNVTNIGGMFYGCSSLEEINLSNFNTHNVTDMSGMFSSCSSLKKINLSNFDTHNVTNMSGMFYGCSSLKKINLSNFDTHNVTNIGWNVRGMFIVKRNKFI